MTPAEKLALRDVVHAETNKRHGPVPYDVIWAAALDYAEANPREGAKFKRLRREHDEHVARIRAIWEGEE